MNMPFTLKRVGLIQSKDDYQFYLDADKVAIRRICPTSLRQKLKSYLTEDVYKFERLLRKAEYHANCDTSVLGKVYASYLSYRLGKACLGLGFEIPINCFGPGLSIAHLGTVVVHGKTRIGANCRIHPCVVPNSRHSIS